MIQIDLWLFLSHIGLVANGSFSYLKRLILSILSFNNIFTNRSKRKTKNKRSCKRTNPRKLMMEWTQLKAPMISSKVASARCRVTFLKSILSVNKVILELLQNTSNQAVDQVAAPLKVTKRRVNNTSQNKLRLNNSEVSSLLQL